MSTAAATSGADARVVQRYGTIAVVGGGCYGDYYVRQLQRAAIAGKVSWRALHVVDRNPACRVATDPSRHRPAGASPPPEMVTAEWRDYFAAAIAAAAPDDAIVPSPLMPHLMVEWVIDRVRSAWPGRAVGLRALAEPLGTPWELANGDAPHYASFATWTCPINCIEPARCPHTKGPRDWTMPATARAWVAARRAAGDPVRGPLVFHCEHRAYGVGMFDTRRVLEAGATVLAAAAEGPCAFLVGTVSHCHGAFGRLVVGDPVASAEP